MSNREQSAEQLFEAALDLPPEQRSAFLDQACPKDSILRRVLHEMLLDHEKLGSFLRRPIVGESETATFSNHARFQPGQTIADRFLVVRFIARGGMGEVYEVTDRYLQDDRVALKIIRPEIAQDAANLHRFEREVILARKVNHSNLCPIYEIFRCQEPAPPFVFLTMKLLQGETLEASLNITGNPTPTPEALEISRQLLAGVAAMHTAGIIHRDLKPNNIMLERTTTGVSVSIMDFGLARLHAADATMQTVGMIAGTPGYMAPELYLGHPPSEASDIFALGVVLHRVFTGERPVLSSTGAATPAPSLRHSQAPAYLVQGIEGFLSPDLDQRRRAFASVQHGGVSPRIAEKSAMHPPKRRALFLLTAGCILATLAIIIAALLTSSGAPGPLDSTQITTSTEPKAGPLFTDGARLHFNSRGEPSEMATSGGIIAPTHIFGPGFQLLDISADGSKALALTHDRNQEINRGTLWTESILGGTPRKLNDHLAVSARWSPDGRSIVFADEDTLYRMDADGGNIAKLWHSPGFISDFCVSPDTRVLSVSVSSGIEIGTSRLWQIGANGENAHPQKLDWPAGTNQFSGQWTPDGRHFVFISDRDKHKNVYEVLAPHWFQFWKKPTAVRITGNQIDIQAIAPARDSKSLFALGRPDEGAAQVLDSQTGRFVPYLDGLAALNFVISPDRQWMVYLEYPTHYLWKSRLDGSEKLQLTSSYSFMPQWSPDGKWVTYTDWHNIYRVSADGGTPEKLISDSEEGKIPIFPSFSPDGSSIVWCPYPYPGVTLTGIHLLDLASRKRSVMPGSAEYYAPSWSPDGKYLLAMTQNPSRMMLYSAEMRTWRKLKQFDLQWGYWIWSSDSKSIYMAVVEGPTGIYRLSIPDAAWSRVSSLDGVADAGGQDGFPSLTPDGRPVLMSRTGIAQIYSLAWKP